MARLLLVLLLALVGCADPPVTSREVSAREAWRGDWKLSADLPTEVQEGFVRASDEWHRATEGAVDQRVVAIVHYPELQPWEPWSVTSGDRPTRVLATTHDCAIIFDEREWTEDKAYRVALHEIGHVVGLDHNGVQGSLMYPKMSATVTGVDDLALEALEGVQ